MIRFTRIVIPLIIAGAVVYVFRVPLRDFVFQTTQQVAPCSLAVSYKIGAIDPRFNITQAQVLKDVQAATAVWDTAAGKTLFSYDPANGVVTVNFVYDARQERTITLKGLGLTLNDDSASYDAVKAKYVTVLAVYSQKKAAFAAESATYDSEVNAYQSEVEKWNAQGGAPANIYAQLNQEKADLAQKQTTLVQLQDDANVYADNVNALVSELNHLASVLNVDTSTYNTGVGTSTNAEFEEAVFESQPGHEDINVYEYDSNDRLVRVLSHEFGHALGLQHVSDPHAIMYALNQSTNETPTSADIKELDAVCRLSSNK